MAFIILAFVCIIVAGGFCVKGFSDGPVDGFLPMLAAYGITIVGLAFVMGFMFFDLL